MVALLLAMVFAEPETKSYTVDGFDRKALVYAPTEKTAHPPILFAFHGHTGTMGHAARTFDLQSKWPEAVVVYPQGLPTATLNDRQGKFAGWQPEGRNGDRDLHFFDTMLTDLAKQYQTDPKRTYAMGHSNGASFTYLLWRSRTDKFAAVAPVAGVFLGSRFKTPVSCFVAGGEQDALVSFTRQSQGIQEMAKLFGITEEVSTKAKSTPSFYKGKSGDMGVYIHAGGHNYPTECSQMIVDFFKAHPKP